MSEVVAEIAFPEALAVRELFDRACAYVAEHH
jgi:hypothetical protein